MSEDLNLLEAPKVKYVVVSNLIGEVEKEINDEFNLENLSPEELTDRLISEALEFKEISLDTENGGLICFQDDAVLIQISSPVNNYVFRALDFNDFVPKLLPILTSQKIVVIGHNLGYDQKFLRWHFGFELENVWDAMITEANLVLGKVDPSTKVPLSLSLKEVAYRRLGLSLDKDLRKEFIGMDRNSPVRRELYDYSADDAAILFEIKRQQQQEAKKLKMEKVVWLENSVVPVTADMEYNGFEIDLPKWKSLTVQNLLESLDLLNNLQEYYGYTIIWPEPPVIRLKKDGTPCARQKKPVPFYNPSEEANTLAILRKAWVEGNLDVEDAIERFTYHMKGHGKTLNLNSPQNLLKILKDEGLEKIIGYELTTTKADEMDKIDKLLETVEEFDGKRLRDLMTYRKKQKLLGSFYLAVPKLINPVTQRLHPTFHQMPREDNNGGTTTGRYSCCIAEGQKVTVLGGEKNIEDIKIGDYVYSLTDTGEVCFKKVLNTFCYGEKEVIKLSWETLSTHRKGSLVCTPDHKIRLTNNTWKEAENCKGEKVKYLKRFISGDRWNFNSSQQQIQQEQLLIKKDIFGLVSSELHIHHKDKNTLNNSLDNLEILTPKAHKAKHEGEQSLDKHPLWKEKSKFSLLRMLVISKGNIRNVTMDFNTYKRKCKLAGINLKLLKKRFNDKGDYLSKSRIIKAHQEGGNCGVVSKRLGVGTRVLKELCAFYNIDYNHKIISVEPFGKAIVYDLHIEDTHKFYVNELCVSNSNPNFQQMPASEVLRSCFVARKGRKIITADYSSMEVRIAANVTGDPVLVEFFGEHSLEDMPKGPDGNPVDPSDFHGYSASIVFQRPRELVSKRLKWNEEKQEYDELDPIEKKWRKIAKVATFAVFYGAKAHGEFQDEATGKKIEYGLYLKLGITKKEAEEVVQRYGEAYAVAVQAFEDAGILAHKRRILEGVCGRLKWVTPWDRKNSIARKAKNFKIQECNATQTKYALYLLRKRLSGDKFMILSTVHDEIIAEVDENVAEEYAAIMADIMVEAATKILDGPVKYAASYKVADYWMK